MKKHFILAAMATAALFTACSNEDPIVQETENVPVSFVIGGIDSRATTSAPNFSTLFDNGDKIGITGTNMNPAMTNALYNVSVSENSATIAAAENATFAYGDQTAVFNAYYPYAENFAGTFSVQADQSKGISSSDFLTATATGSKDNATVTLNFDHRLTLVQVKLTGLTDVSSITLKNAQTNVSFTNSTDGSTQGTVVLVSDDTKATADIIMYPQTKDATYWAIVPAQELAAGKLFIVTTSNGKTYSYTTTTTTTFAEGTIAKYSLKVTSDEPESQSTLVEYAAVTVNSWNADNNLTGESDIEITEDILNLSPITISTPSTAGSLVPNTTNTFATAWRYNNGSATTETDETNGTYIKYTAPTTLSTNWYNDGIAYYCTEKINKASTYTLKFSVKGSNTLSLHVYVAVNEGGNKVFQVTKIGETEQTQYSLAPLSVTTEWVEKTIVINPANYTTGVYQSVSSWTENTIAQLPFAIAFKPKTASTAAVTDDESTDVDETADAVDAIYYIKDVSFVQN